MELIGFIILSLSFSPHIYLSIFLNLLQPNNIIRLTVILSYLVQKDFMFLFLLFFKLIFSIFYN